MEKLFKLATSISTPLALSGLFAAIVFYIFGKIVSKNIFPKLTAVLGGQILSLIIQKLSILALVAMTFGFVGYLVEIVLPRFGEASRSQAGPLNSTLVSQLQSPSKEIRVLALTRLSESEVEDPIAATEILRVLETSINKLGALPIRLDIDSPNQELSAAFSALSKTLRMANNKAFNVHSPEFRGIGISSLDLSNSYLPGAIFIDSVINDTILDGVDLSGGTFTGVQLAGVRAHGINLMSARIQQSCIEDSQFDNANMRMVRATSSDFNGTSFQNADLTNATISNSRLSFVKLDGAQLTGSDLTTALELTSKQLQNARSSDHAKLPNPIFNKSKLSICKVKLGSV